MAALPHAQNDVVPLELDVVIRKDSYRAADPPSFELPGQIKCPDLASINNQPIGRSSVKRVQLPPSKEPEDGAAAAGNSGQASYRPVAVVERHAEARSPNPTQLTGSDPGVQMHSPMPAMTMGPLTEKQTVFFKALQESETAEEAAPSPQPWGLYAAALAASGLAWLASKVSSPWTGLDAVLSTIYLVLVFGMLSVCIGQQLRPQWHLRFPPLLLSCSLLALIVLEAKSRLACGHPPVAAWGAASVQAALLQCLAVLLPDNGGGLLAAGTMTVALAAVIATEGQLRALEIVQCLLLPATTMFAAARLASAVAVGRCQQLRDFVLGRKTQASRDALLELVPTITPGTKVSMVQVLELIVVKLKCADLPPPFKNFMRLLMKKLLQAARQAVMEDDSSLVPHLSEAPDEVQEFVLNLLPNEAARVSTSVLAGAGQMVSRHNSVTLSFDQHLEALLQPLRHQEPPMSAILEEQSAKAQQLLAMGLGQWGFDLFSFAAACGNRPLQVVGQGALDGLVVQLGVDQGVLSGFLEAIESRYRSSNAYHNSLHAADVLNSMVYYFGLQSTTFPSMPPLEKMAALIAACGHDVGHDGVSNRFHTSAETPLAQLFNDQSCLENMHAAITVALCKGQGTNFVEPFLGSEWKCFRGLVVGMILDTDLGKHFSSMSAFKKDFLDGTPLMENAKHRHMLLGMALKACDVGGSAKPMALHARWATLVNTEFFRQGDLEKELGLPCSPFCDRLVQNVADSQKGFYEFIASPLLTNLNDYLQSRRLALEVLAEAKVNQKFWLNFDSSSFNYDEPVASVPMLVRRCTKDRSSSQLLGGNSRNMGGATSATAVVGRSQTSSNVGPVPQLTQKIAPRCHTSSQAVQPIPESLNSLASAQRP